MPTIDERTEKVTRITINEAERKHLVQILEAADTGDEHDKKLFVDLLWAQLTGELRRIK